MMSDFYIALNFTTCREHSVDESFSFTDLGSSLIGEIKARPTQDKIELLPRFPALLFGMEVSMYLWACAGVEKGLCWVEKYLSIHGCVPYNRKVHSTFKQLALKVKESAE